MLYICLIYICITIKEKISISRIKILAFLEMFSHVNRYVHYCPLFFCLIINMFNPSSNMNRRVAHMDINAVAAKNIRDFRELRGLSQEKLAELCGVDRTFISKVERGDRNLTIDTLDRIASALETPPHLLLVENYLDGTIGKMEVDLIGLSEMVESNPSLRSFIVGYQAEYMCRREISRQLGITKFKKYDDHDRTKHGDIWFDYNGREYSIECKCLQSNYVEFDEKTGTWSGKYQCDGSDATEVTLPNGHTVTTVSYPFGMFDIVAVGLFAFGDRWSFAFVKTEDLLPRKYTKRSKIPEEDCPYFIKTMQDVTLPLKAPYTSQIIELL